MKPAHADQKYIEALLNNDVVLIKEIYQKWGKEARNFVIKNSGSAEDAKDVFQETLAAVLLKVRKEKFTLTVPFGGYLYFIYKAKWFNRLNKNGRNQVMIHDLERYKDDSNFLRQFAEMEFIESRFDILKECFGKLSERCQNIINAKYFDGLKGKEIKDKFNFPSIGAVSKAMYDCRENLKKCMTQHPNFNDLNL